MSANAWISLSQSGRTLVGDDLVVSENAVGKECVTFGHRKIIDVELGSPRLDSNDLDTAQVCRARIERGNKVAGAQRHGFAPVAVAEQRMIGRHLERCAVGQLQLQIIGWWMPENGLHGARARRASLGIVFG